MTYDKVLAEAVVEVLATIEPFDKDATADAGQYSYKYTKLSTALGILRPLFAAQGVVILQPVTSDDAGNVVVVTRLLHRSGESMDLGALTMAKGSNPQQTGSAVSYARRYSLFAALGLEVEDDDGAAASQGDRPKRQRSKRSTPEEEAGVQMLTRNQVVNLLVKETNNEQAARELWNSKVEPWFEKAATDGKVVASQAKTFVASLVIGTPIVGEPS